MKPTPIAWTAFETPLGWLAAEFSQNGLMRLKPCRQFEEGGDLRRARAWIGQTAAALEARCAGRALRRLPEMDLLGGTVFQQAAWSVLLQTPPRTTLSYTEVARRAGRPHAVRAAGSACGRNPIPVLIPCHRAVRSDGGLGGFAWGLEWKRFLLRAEGHSV